MMKTVKRKANVGERILITKEHLSCGHYKNGDTFEVDRMFGTVGVKTTVGNMIHIKHAEYEVIVETPKKSARIAALETQVATLQAKVEALEASHTVVYNAAIHLGENTAETASKVAEVFRKLSEYPLTARFERESAEVDGILADIKRKAKPTPTANEQRADVIKRAKAYVAKWTKRAASITREDGNSALMNRGSMTTEFIVNADKRTVVCLAKSNVYGDIRGKGIAKCDPDDVFNADIGKAIALARALGVGTPEEFVKAVQPTEVVVGQRFKTTGEWRKGSYGKVTKLAPKYNGFYHDIYGGYLRHEDIVITDDTDAVYE